MNDIENAIEKCRRWCWIAGESTLRAWNADLIRFTDLWHPPRFTSSRLSHLEGLRIDYRHQIRTKILPAIITIRGKYLSIDEHKSEKENLCEQKNCLFFQGLTSCSFTLQNVLENILGTFEQFCLLTLFANSLRKDFRNSEWNFCKNSKLQKRTACCSIT